jgi:hypothetical protein
LPRDFTLAAAFAVDLSALAGFLAAARFYLAAHGDAEPHQMVNYFPESIPHHGAALNITVQGYAGKSAAASAGRGRHV